MVLLLICLAGMPARSQDDKKEEKPPSTWTPTESKLANHYIKLLQKDPAYGKVFGLLWDLYQKHDQIDLLVGYFESASEAEQPAGGVATLLYAHLVRKRGQTDKAATLYSKVLKTTPGNVAANKALAEIADQQKRFKDALSFYDRLMAWIPVKSEDGVAIRLRRAALQKQLGQPEEAVKGWNEILKAYPGNAALRSEIVAMLLEAGETSTAIEVLEDLVKSAGPREKLDSLMELNRLYEFISDFDKAVETAREGMALVHFKDHQHEKLFTRLVSAYERFNHLGDLQSELEEAANRDNPGEKDLYLLAEFFRLTANPLSEEDAVFRLVQKLPADVDYRVRLAEVQMTNDRYEAAAETLDEVLKDQPEIPLRLVLLRARVAVTDENPVVAEETLSTYLEKHPGDPDITKKIIEFARSFYLDKLVEKLLREGRASGVAGSDGESAPMDLARFLKERGRKQQAAEILIAYVDAAGEATLEKARRFHQVATAFREIGMPDEAASAVKEAIALAPGNVAYLTTKADILVDEKEIDEAIATLEIIWALQKDLGDRTDTDQRIFTLLRGHYTKDKVDPDAKLLKNGAIRTNSQYQKIAAAASRLRRDSDDGPPKEVLDYFALIRKNANTSPSVATRYRAAWWALKLQNNRECYFHLTAAQAEAGSPVVEIEKMLLKLADANERIGLKAGHLLTLSRIDPDNAEEYLQKRALIRFEMGYEDEAVRALVEMVNKPNASLNTLNTLAKIYKLQGSTTKHIDVWRNAFRKANLYEKRSIIKQLSSALIESNKPEEALKVQLELIEKENDPVQRRKQLDSQLATGKAHFLLEWLQDQYAVLAQKEPFDRFYPEALGRIQLAAGHEEEAFASMKKAYYMSGQDSDLLDELGELASHLGNLKSAIYYRRQVIAKAGDETSIGNWQSLIEMLEKDLRVGEADLLRRRLETKFGQDPEFLGGLAKHYRENNHLIAAQRVLQKLVTLRSWDIHAMLELGLLKSEAGEFEEAQKWFTAVLDQTGDATVPRSARDRPLWPIIRVPRPGSDLSAEEQLQEMAMSVDSYPPANGAEAQEQLVDWLQQPHLEFDYLPRDEYFVRLRAIEEAAAIFNTDRAGDDRRSKWLSRWTNDGTVPAIEILWATRYSGAKKELNEFLAKRQEEFDPEDRIDRIWFAFSMLLAGKGEELTSWTEQPGSVLRVHFSTLAGYLLLRNQAAREPLYDREVVEKFLSDMPLNLTTGTHIFSELRKEGKPDPALFIGRLLVDSELIDDGNSLFQISQMAHLSGRDTERVDWLNRAIEEMVSHPGPGVPGLFYAALTERLSLLESDQQRELFAREWQRRVDTNPGSELETRLEKVMLLDLAIGKTAPAIATLGEISRKKTGMIQSQRVMVGGDYQMPINVRTWPVMNSLLARNAGRFLLKTPQESVAFVEALGSGEPFVAKTTGDANSEYDIFEIERLSWLLEWQNLPERLATVKRIYANLQSPKSGMDLARILQERGYMREAAFVFRSEAAKGDEGYAPFHGVFEVCHDALDPDPGLELIRQLNDREIPAPAGLTVDFLNEQQARFLFHNRDIERLFQLGKPPEVRKGAPPITTTGHLPFQYALIRAYRQMGADENLLRFLTRLRAGSRLDKSYLLLGAQLLRKKADYPAAMEWIDSISFDGTRSKIEGNAMLEVIAVQEESGEPDEEVMLHYTRISLKTQPVPVTLLLVDALHRAGGSQEAEGVMRLLYRKTRNQNFRDQIALQLLKTRLEEGTDWSDLSADLEMLLNGLRRKKTKAPTGLVKLLVKFPPEELIKTRENFRISGMQTDQAWFARLLIASLEGTLQDTAVSLAATLPRDRFESLLETLPAFGETGKSVATEIIETTGQPGGNFFRNEPERQIRFYAAIGDLNRLTEVHADLIQEAESAAFRDGSSGGIVPTLMSRYQLPGLFSEAGYPELAGSLFRKYHDGIAAYHRRHSQFLNEYVKFLIERNQFSEAERILGRSSRKALGIDLRFVVTLYQKWGKLDEWESQIARFEFSKGEKNLLSEWRTALAEGREMVHYNPGWE